MTTDTRAEFESAYIAHLKQQWPLNKCTPQDLAVMREGDGYGDGASHLAGAWWGWRAASVLGGEVVAWMRTYRQFRDSQSEAPDPGYMVTSFHQNAEIAAKYPDENVPLFAHPTPSAPAQPVALEEWKLVPVEPTPQQQADICESYWGDGWDDYEMRDARLVDARNMYQAMISGSPTAPAQDALASKPAAPGGFALVPLILTREMDEVLSDEGWQWEDLLAAAEAITEEQYNQIATAPAQSCGDAATGIAEADRIINRLLSSDPQFDDCSDAVDLIRKLIRDHRETTSELRAAEQADEAVTLSDDEADDFERTVDDFNDDGETATDYAMLMDWATRGLLECTHFEVTQAGNDALAARAKEPQ